MEVTVKKAGIIPIALEFIESIELEKIFNSYIPSGKEEISHSQVLKVLLLNILDDAQPLYGVSDWLSKYSDGIGSGLAHSEKYHDKRLSSSLDALFDSDRHSILMKLSTNAIQAHKLMTERVQNDLTRISFTGSYNNHGKLAEDLQITNGYHPTLKGNVKQLVFGLSVTSDGHVPLWFDVYSGNTSDNTTHANTWDNLKNLLKKTDFTYVADSKLADKKDLALIANNGGYFITILPANRKEVKDFKKSLRSMNKTEWLKNRPCDWSLKYEPEKKDGQKNEQKYRLKEGEKSQDNFPILWVYSESKAKKENETRTKKIEKQLFLLAELNDKKINKRKLKTREGIEDYLHTKLANVSDYIDIQITEKEEVVKTKIGKGRIGANSKFKETKKTKYHIDYKINEDKIQNAARVDGLFPLIHNKETKPAVSILQEYKEQPYLENRFKALKSVLDVAPIFVEKIERIQAMLFLYFIALMIIALIERRIRNNMVKKSIDKIAVLPQNKKTATPTWNAIRNLFSTIIHVIIKDENTNKTHSQVKGISEKHKVVLELLEIDIEKYQPDKQDWWLQNKQFSFF